VVERHIRAVHPGPPLTVANERAVMPCGCAVYIGLRMDTHEPTLGATACSDAHKGKVHAFLAAYHESLDAPSDRPAVEVADEILTRVFARE
jgi:hypothetical protein